MSDEMQEGIDRVLALIDDEGDDELLATCAWLYLYILWLSYDRTPIDATAQRELATMPKDILREAQCRLAELHAIAVGDGGWVITALGQRAHLASLADYGVTLD
ncbi:MAG: hypothetical protein WBP12_03875 [Candidatus Saccharimonas sp.]